MLLGSLDNVFPERLVVVIGLYNQNNKLRAIFFSCLLTCFRIVEMNRMVKTQSEFEIIDFKL